MRRADERLPRTLRPTAWGALVSLLVLAGCGGKMPWDKTVQLPCPDYRIPAEAASLVKFRDGPGRDLTDVEHQGRIVNIRLACLHDIDEDTGTGTLEVEVAPIIAVERGPADTDRRATYPYFIAVTDTEQTILFRQRLTENVEFTGNRTRRAVEVSPSTLEIPLDEESRGRDFVVYIGFDLSREQVEFNRNQLDGAPR